MRVGFITQWFPPEPGTDVAACIANGLASRGHQVDVITGFPNYPTGRLHDGYQMRPHAVERTGNLAIHRCMLYPSHDRSAMRRAANYLTFSVGASWGTHKAGTPDVWLVYSSPATAAVPALLAGWRRGTPVCLLIQDLWPDSVVDSNFLGSRSTQLVHRVLDRFCAWTYGRAAAIGVISPTMKKVLQARGVSSSKIFYTPNPSATAAQVDPSPPPSRNELGLPAGRNFMYAGNVGELQHLMPVLEAFRQVPEASLVVVGDGVERRRLQSLVQQWAAPNITFLGSQPAARAQELIRASDVQVVSLRDTPLLRATMPSKVQSVLGAGKPVLAHAAGDVAALVERERCGWTAPPGDVPRLVARIRGACQATVDELCLVGERGRAYAIRAFSPDAVAERLETMLRSAHEPEEAPV